MLPRVADVSSLLAAVAGPGAAPLTLAVSVTCPQAAGGDCHLSLSLACRRLAVMGADPQPHGGRLQ
jgi:hypothetical protein